MLNRTEFGPTSALFSDSAAQARRFLAEGRHGMMHANRGAVPDNDMPLGGNGISRVGANSAGPTAVNFHTSKRSAHIAL